MLMNRTSSGSRWHIRPDGPDKVSGKLQYLTDLTVPDMLYGKVLRSKHPHAIILSIRTEAAERLEGVHAVLTHRDVPGMNRFGIVIPDQPVFCEDRVRYIGDAIAAVAAETKELAEYALSLIEVEYDLLPVISDPEQALHPKAPRLHVGGNILHRTNYKRGDIEAAFAACAHVVEETYITPRQMHAYMETEGGLFVPEADGRLTIYAATQHGFKDRMQLSRILEMPESQLRIISSPIGGSFGGKDELNVQPYGALLAVKSGRPVKLHNSRRESVKAGLKRHPMKITMRTGTDRTGKLVAHQVRIMADTGAYATLGGPVLNFATEHAMGPYRIPHVDVEGVSVFTNNGVSGEFRGFGGNQAIFGVESQMDRLAEKLGMDPWTFRKLNLRLPSDPGPYGQRIVANDGTERVWQSVHDSPIWQRRDRLEVDDEEPWLHRGVGAAIAMHGSGLGFGIPDPGAGRLSLNKEGRIEAAFSFEEFGQGIYATLELLLMDSLDCRTEDLSIVLGDTDRVPHSGSSTASRSTTIAYMALQRLKPIFTSKLIETAAVMVDLPAETLHTGPGGIWDSDHCVVTYKHLAEVHSQLDDFVCTTEFHFPVTPDPIVGGHYLYTSTAVAVEVEVNTLTGQVRVSDVYHAVAAGPAVNPMGYIGQIEGASVMALGFTLTEDAVLKEGRYVTENLDTYIIPTVRDVSAGFALHAIEELPEGDPFGPRGIGEVGSVALAPAVTAAVHHAVGKWVSRLPIDKEEIIERFRAPTAEGVKSS